MGARFHNARYPSYSLKNGYGPMPRWLKRRHHRLGRRYARVGLQRADDLLPEVPRSKTCNMWYSALR